MAGMFRPALEAHRTKARASAPS